MTGRLEGKSALITGGAGGIGSVTARLFAAEGARVAIADSDADALAAATAAIIDAVPDAAPLAVQADISEPGDAERAVAETAAAFGGLSVLINNAGVREFGPLGEASPESWDRIVGVNLLGTANCARAALPALREAAGAAIVNIASVYAAVGRKGMGQYDATKAGIVSLTRTLAWEEADNGIRVNAVCPGATLTPYHRDRYTAMGLDRAAIEARQWNASLLGRWAAVEEIAWPILWLASNEASFITGACLMVDGGTSIM